MSLYRLNKLLEYMKTDAADSFIYDDYYCYNPR